MAASEWRFFWTRRLRWPHGAIWMSFYVLLCIVGQNFCCEEESLAASLKQLCFCHNKHTLHCQGINDTHLFKTTPQSSFQGNLFVWKKCPSLDQPVTTIEVLNSVFYSVVAIKKISCLIGEQLNGIKVAINLCIFCYGCTERID